MLEISAKRQDIFRRVVFSISLYFCNPRFQAAWSCHVAYTHCEREATYILEMSHILLTLQGTKEEKSEGLVEEKAREREDRMGWRWRERARRPKGERRVWHRGSESRASGTGNWGASQARRRKQGCHSQGGALKTRCGRVGYPARFAGLRESVGLENCSHQCLRRWCALVVGALRILKCSSGVYVSLTSLLCLLSMSVYL